MIFHLKHKSVPGDRGRNINNSLFSAFAVDQDGVFVRDHVFEFDGGGFRYPYARGYQQIHQGGVSGELPGSKRRSVRIFVLETAQEAFYFVYL